MLDTSSPLAFSGRITLRFYLGAQERYELCLFSSGIQLRYFDASGSDKGVVGSVAFG